MKNTLAMPFSTLAFVLSLCIASESWAATTCAWEKDADGNDTTKLVISGSGSFNGCGNKMEFSDWKTKATEIEIKEGIDGIRNGAFYGATNVTSVNIPDSVTSIGNSAFRNMTSLNSVNLPNTITSIGEYAFSGDSAVTELSLPNSLVSIGSRAFYNMNSVNGILEIPDSVQIIGAYAFYGMNSLDSSIIIPDSVQSIGVEAFSGGSQELVIFDSITQKQTEAWARSAFHGIEKGNIRCIGDIDKCTKAMEKFMKSSGCTAWCLPEPTIIKEAESKDQCIGKYAWNEATGKCNRMTEWQCNDYRDENNERKYYFNGNTCTKLPKNGKISCVNACYKINDGYCDRVCYTPAEAAKVLNEDNNTVTLTFKKQ